MTEAEWLGCHQPREMLEHLRGKVSERKMRLVACAANYRYAALVPEGWFESALRAAEEYADTRADTPDVVSFRTRALYSFRNSCARYFPSPERMQRSFFGGQVSALQHLCLLLSEDSHLSVPVNLWGQATAAYPIAEPGCEEVTWEEGWKAIELDRADYPVLLREVIGNPFRNVAFSTAWRTETTVSLAAQMYESRDFSAMPILADALEESGCDNRDILDHCRDPSATHIRGC